MPGFARDFGAFSKTVEVVRAGVLGPTNAGTASQDLGTARQGRLFISLNAVGDVPTNVVLQHSWDNATWTNIQVVPNASLAASTFYQVELTNIALQRYVRLTWTRATAFGTSHWAVWVVGDLAVISPIP